MLGNNDVLQSQGSIAFKFCLFENKFLYFFTKYSSSPTLWAAYCKYMYLNVQGVAFCFSA